MAVRSPVQVSLGHKTKICQVINHAGGMCVPSKDAGGHQLGPTKCLHAESSHPA